jgi:hypothetical protein
MKSVWIRAVTALGLVAALVYSPPVFAGPDDDETENAATEPVAERVTRSQRDQQLRRSSGQTRFLSASENFMAQRGALEATAMSASAGGSLQSGTAQREVVEADVFTVDEETKTLILLNGQRGLQTVSASNELLGRAAASGNAPNDMYRVFRGDSKRVVVLEQDYQRRYDEQQGARGGAAKIRIVTYDVSDPSRPKLLESLPLEGTIADSRLVGDVLYLAASVYPNQNDYGYYGPQQQEAKGRVYSIKVTGEKLELVHTHEIGLPQVGAEMMQIVETPVGNGKFTYHLLALSPGADMTTRGWSWERGSAIEVVDITDPSGKATSVLKVNARGYIDKRTQLTLRDGHLLAASNYIAKEGDWNSTIRRVSVESWALPKARGNKTLSEQEASFRRSFLERELAKGKGKGLDEDELDGLREELLDAKDTGLRGYFVRQGEGKPLTKLVPDSQANTGDTNGQSASLRDVRFHGNKILAFWVPGNMIDPLDIFLLANGKVVYANRTEFDGWIETARVFEHGGRTFLLGLGFTVPAANNDRNRRYPQAKLFEIVEEGGKHVAKAVATHVIRDKNMWPSLSGPDRYLDARANEKGEGSVMFTVATRTKDGYVQGGKLLGFDLNAALVGDADKVFQEGALLAGNADWIRRLFVRSDIVHRVMFSDKALADFGPVANGVGSPKHIQRAAEVLELARNLRHYVTLGADHTVGVQVVSDNASYWYFSGQAQTTELRVVTDSHADAERGAVKQIVTLPGTFEGHTIVDHGEAGQELLVLVRRTEEVGDGPDVDSDPWQAEYTRQWQTVFEVHSVRESGGQLFARKAAEWIHDGRYYGGYYWGWRARQSGLGTLTVLDDGSVALSNGDKLRRLAFGEWLPPVPAAGGAVTFPAWQLEDLVIEGAPSHVNVPQALVRLGRSARNGDLALTWQVPVTVAGETTETAPVTLTRNYLAPVQLKNGALVLGKPVNIPGTPVARLAGGYVLTEEGVLQDIARIDRHPDDEYGPETSFRPLFLPVVQSVKVTASTATLADIKPADGRSFDQYSQLGAQGPLVTFRRDTESGGGIYPMFGGGLRGGWRPRRWYGSQSAELEFVNVDAAGLLRFERRAANGVVLTDYPQLVDVFPAPKKGSFYGIVMEGNRLQVVAIDAKTGATQVVRIVPVDEVGQRQEAVAASFIPNSYWWSWGETRPVTFNPTQRNIVVAGGLAGACQFYLVEEGKKAARK